LGRTFPFPGEGGKVRNRRIFLVAAPFSEGLLTEATAAAQHRLQEPLFMPHSGPSPTPPGLAQEGGKARFHRRGRVDAVAPKRSISAEVRRWVGDCGMCICAEPGERASANTAWPRWRRKPIKGRPIAPVAPPIKTRIVRPAHAQVNKIYSVDRGVAFASATAPSANFYHFELRPLEWLS